jgi:4-amino-4-deoxy-L-arabinose transferase-like glycosyltransferase
VARRGEWHAPLPMTEATTETVMTRRTPSASDHAAGAGTALDIGLLWICVATIVGASIIRYMFITTIDLRVDEAYYWTWSKEHVISYLDHPPMVAWLIRLSTLVFGDTNFGVRFPGLFAMSLMQLQLGGIVWRVARDFRYVVAAVLMTEASLAYGLGMAKITPDVGLIPCELAMCWSLVRMAHSNDHRWWLAAGFTGGLALLAKYTAVLLVPAVAAFVLVPDWRREQIASRHLWLGVGIAVLVFSPVLYWNAMHDWASFRFQLGRPAQVPGWSARFLLDFAGQQFGLIGILLLPIVLVGTAMVATRGYRQRDPVSILLSTAVLFPLGFFVWHGLSARIGDSWMLFVWPMAFACAAINLKQVGKLSRSRLARIASSLLVVALASGIALVTAVQIYYVWGTANLLRKNDPIGKEAGFADVVAAADASRITLGAKWIVTTDYRIYSLLRWHLKDAVPVVQLNERRRFIGFAEPKLVGPVGLCVTSRSDPEAAILSKTSAKLEPVGEINLTWRGTAYDTYLLQKLTNWKPVLSPPPDDPFARAYPH